MFEWVKQSGSCVVLDLLVIKQSFVYCFYVVESSSLNSFDASGNFCHLSVTFANSLDQDQHRQNSGPALDPNGLTL